IGERPYKCHLPDCGRAFIQLSNLQQHLRNHDAQVERAKNRPFHCNICGKGFATESSLRTHTSKELQLHLGVLQQHAALIGGPNATSCPICHKLFLGTDALMEHMKHVHKEKPNQNTNNSFIDNIASGVATCVSNSVNMGTCAGSAVADNSACLQSSGTPSVCSDPYSAKRRTANNPCPVCGKHYVNEGSLRKHLACHAETSQLTNSLRMWPCSVCQAVFTHENGLLTHMEHMRMDPKHQFAAQYVLSRAAAERRERGSLLAVTLAASAGAGAGGSGGFMPLLSGEIGSHTGVNGGDDGGGDMSNSLCPSPSAHSECSSNGRPSSSTTSDQCSGINLLTNNNNDNSMNNNNHNHNNINNNNNNNNNNNENCNASSTNLNLSNKLSDILRTSSSSNSHAPAQHHSHHSSLPHHHQHNLNNHSYNNVGVSIEGELHDVANRMSLMAAASAAAAAVAASTSTSGVPRVSSSPQNFSVETAGSNVVAHVNGNVAVQAAVVNLAAAMRINHANNNAASSGATNISNNNMLVNHGSRNQQQQQQPQQSLQQQQQQNQQASEQILSERRTSPLHNLVSDNAPVGSMMRNSMLESSAEIRNTNHQHQQRQQENNDQHKQTHSRSNFGSSTLQTPLPASLSTTNTHQSHHHFTHQTLNTQNHHLQHQSQLETTHTTQPPAQHSPQTAMHMQQQAEAILRSHTEVAFRLAAGVAASSSNNQNSGPINNSNNCSTSLDQLSNNNNNDDDMSGKLETNPRNVTNSSISAASGCGNDNVLNRDPTQQAPKMESIAPASDISETIRAQEHRLEQALRLRSDARTFNFLSGNRQHITAISSNTSSVSKPQQQN
uniref:C2H2-type domain-containing protein n=1 Tax=Glossina brevipalpis TaxID=37001 RepID=A0A1A9WQ81_9MUSC